MFKSKQKLDQHVKLTLSKAHDEDEKRKRGFQIAKLYYSAKEFETAKKYLEMFLSVRQMYAPAHRLMGEILEQCSKPQDLTKALAAYRLSYDLDTSQNELLLKVCTLLNRMTLTTEQTATASVWIERARDFYPNEPTIFNLQEKLIMNSTNGSGAYTAEQNDDMKELLLNNLSKRPGDIAIRLKLLRLYEKEEALQDIYNNLLEVELCLPYGDSLQWFTYTSQILMKFVQPNNDESAWCVALMHCYSAAKLAIKRKPVSLASEMLRKLDYALFQSVSVPGDFLELVRDELRSQQLALAGTLLTKSKVNKDGNAASALFVAACSRPMLAPTHTSARTKKMKDMYAELRKMSALRLLETGTLGKCNMNGNEKSYLTRLRQQFYNFEGKEKLFSLVFPVELDSGLSSLFMTEPSLEQVEPRLPTAEEKKDASSVALKLRPHSLHDAVWIMKQSDEDSIAIPDFDHPSKLSFSPANLDKSEPESLSTMDMYTFLWCTVRTTALRLEELQLEQDRLLPIDLSSSLCTEDQQKWWAAVMSTGNDQDLSSSLSKFGRQRHTMCRGIETIRLCGNQLDIDTVCYVARKLQSTKANDMEQREKITLWTRRYWTKAVTLLSRNHHVPASRERLFFSYEREITATEKENLLAEGRLWIALYDMEENDNDAALDVLVDLPQAEASHAASKIYRRAADAILAQYGESGPSPILTEKRVALLKLAQDMIHVTMDRVTTDRHNPLNVTLTDDLEAIEAALRSTEEEEDQLDSFASGNNHTSLYDSEVKLLKTKNQAIQLSHANDSISNGTLASAPNGRANAMAFSTPDVARGSSRRTPSNHNVSLSLTDLNTPVRARPSPERLDAQVKSLLSIQDTHQRHIEGLRRAVDEGRERERKMQESIDDMQSELRQLMNQKSQVKLLTEQQQSMQAELTELKSASAGSAQNTENRVLQQQLISMTSLVANMTATNMNATATGGGSNYGTPVRGPPQHPPQYPPQYPPQQPPQHPHQQPLQYPPQQPPQHPHPSQPMMGMTPGSQYGTPNHSQDYTGLGTYPHMAPSGGGKQKLTPQEIQAIADAAAEQGQNEPPDYFVDEGDEYYDDYYHEDEEYEPNQPSFEGPSTLSYMAKGSPAKPMPPAGFFAQSKSQTKIAEPKPAEPGVPPNVVVSKDLMESKPDTAAPKQETPMVVNVPKTMPASSFAMTQATPATTVQQPDSTLTAQQSESPLKPRPSPSKSDGGYRDDGHDPYYEPIIELPPEVEVVTGEENENVLFEEKANLFRMVDKEWKERGKGPAKILEAKDTGKCRMLMRREQIHKVCANHSLQDGMSLRPMGNNGNAWIWTARDFVDDKLIDETFAIRFKNATIASKFKEAFDQAVEKSKAATTKSKDDKPTETAKSDDAPLIDDLWASLKPKPGSWECSSCLIVNAKEAKKCLACGTVNPEAKLSDIPAAAAASGFVAAPAGSAFGSLTSSTLIPTGGAIMKLSTMPTGGQKTLDEISAAFCAQPMTFGSPQTTQTSLGGPNAPAAFNSTSLGKPLTSTPGGPSILSSSTAFTAPVSSSATATASITSTTALVSSTPTSSTSATTSAKPGGSLLMQLLSSDRSSEKTASAPVKAGGFTYTTTPVITSVAVEEPKETEPAKASPFAGFSFKIPAVPPTTSSSIFSQAKSSGFLFTPPSSINSSDTSPASDNKEAPFHQQVLLGASSSLKTSASAPDLSPNKPASESPRKSATAEEYEPDVQFKPVLDTLPDIVDAKTGEEDETKIFGDKCHLYRMDNDVWKERGRGEIKILKHNTKLKYRIVMRREQVLKLCANHAITKDMTVNQFQSSEKALIWVAQDFSDVDVKSDTLCAKFKTTEIAAKFKETFEKCIESLEVGEESTTPTATAVSALEKPAAPTISLSQQFKPKAGEWNCTACYAKNNSESAKCVCCGTANIAAPATTSTPAAPTGTITTSGFKPAGGTSNVTRMLFGKPVSPSGSPIKSTSPVKTMGVPNSPGKYINEEGEGDNIHFDPVIDLPDLIEVKSGEEDEDVLYEHRAKLFRFTGTEWKEKGIGDVRILKHKDTGKARILLRREKILKLACNHLLNEDMELQPMPNAFGKAWIWFAADFSEGEQQDEKFAIRFKDADIASDFKDVFDAAKRGESVTPIIKPTPSSKIPERQRSVPNSPAKPTAETSPAPTPVTGVGAIPKTPQSVFGGAASSIPIASVFGGASPANNKPLKNIFGGISGSPTQSTNQPVTPQSVFGGAPTPQSVFGGAPTPQSVFGGAPTPQSVFGGAPSASQPASGSDVTPQSVFGGSPATGARSVFGGTPDLFNKPKSVFGGSSTSQPRELTAADIFGAAAASPFSGAFGGSDKDTEDGDVVFVREDKPTYEQVTAARDYQLPDGFYLYESRKPCKGCPGCEKNEDELLDHLFYGTPYNKPTSPRRYTAIVREAESLTGFAALSASASGAPAFQKTDNFKWSGAGSKLFTTSPGANTSDHNKSTEHVEEHEPDVHFQPALETLPDIIEVKTGEEDEVKLFCQRGKLYRFDTASNQWKERGVGEMKILKHEANRTVRVLLRREQVHKLVCNHMIKPEIELRPLNSSDQAWCWYAQDFSENELKQEQFAVRFGTVAKAQNFKETFDEAKLWVQSQAGVPTSQPGGSEVPGVVEDRNSTENSGEGSGEDSEEEQASSEYEDDDDEDDIVVMFEKEATVSEKQGNSWKKLGVFTVKVVEENMDVIGGMAVYVYDQEELVNRFLIFIESQEPVRESTKCKWSGYDFTLEPPHRITMQAQFSSSQAAEQFKEVYADGISYAREMKMTESETLQTAMATNPTELNFS